MTNGVLLNIRPANYRERFHAAFAPIGWSIVDSPVLVPEPTGAGLPAAEDFDAVIFTSQIAVDVLAAAPGWLDTTAYGVGPATTEAARRAGFSKAVQTGFDAADLAQFLSHAGFRRAFYPSAEEVSADLSLDDPLRIRRLAVYRMVAAHDLSEEALAAVRIRQPLVVPLFSRRSAKAFEKLLKSAGISAKNANLCAVSISADILGDEGGPWQQRAVADNPTLEAMVAATVKMVRSLSRISPRINQ
jgi:uroporphyrinogen-III synthase